MTRAASIAADCVSSSESSPTPEGTQQILFLFAWFLKIVWGLLSTAKASLLALVELRTF